MSKETPKENRVDVPDEKEDMKDEESTSTSSDDEMLYVYEAFIAEQGY